MARMLFTLSLLLAVAVTAGCSITGRVRVNPPIEVNQYTTHKGIKGIGPVCGELEFKHEF